MSLQPLDDRIVVRPGESEETTASGLVIPDTAKEKPQQGEVLAVGPGRRSEDTGELIPLDVKVGDTVVYSKYGGTEYILDGEDVLILSPATSWPRSPDRSHRFRSARRPGAIRAGAAATLQFNLRFEDSRGVRHSHAQDPEV